MNNETKPPFPQEHFDAINEALGVIPTLPKEKQAQARAFLQQEYSNLLQNYAKPVLPNADAVQLLIQGGLRGMDYVPGVERTAMGALTGEVTPEDLKQTALGNAPGLPEYVTRAAYAGKFPAEYLPPAVAAATIAESISPRSLMKWSGLKGALEKYLPVRALKAGAAAENPLGSAASGLGGILEQSTNRRANQIARMEGATEPGKLLAEAPAMDGDSATAKFVNWLTGPGKTGNKEDQLMQLEALGGQKNEEMDRLLGQSKSTVPAQDPIDAILANVKAGGQVGGSNKATQKVVQEIESERPSGAYADQLPLIHANQTKRNFQTRAAAMGGYEGVPDVAKPAPKKNANNVVYSSVGGDAEKNIAKGYRANIESALDKETPGAGNAYRLLNQDVLGSMIGQKQAGKALSQGSLDRLVQTLPGTGLGIPFWYFKNNPAGYLAALAGMGSMSTLGSTSVGKGLRHWGNAMGAAARPQLLDWKQEQQDSMDAQKNLWKTIMEEPQK